MQRSRRTTDRTPGPRSVPGDNDTPRIDADGFVHVRNLTIPPSDLWSPAFRKFYATLGAPADPTQASRLIPARTATQAEWSDFDAWVDEQYISRPLAAALHRYPVDIVDTHVNGVRVSVVSPKGGVAHGNRRRALINLHAGGFVVNRGLNAGKLESIPVASLSRIVVVTVDYRQAPLHRYPAASEDVEAVYLDLLKQCDPDAIGIYGCSAGGVLASQVIARFQSSGLPRPGAVGIFNMAPPPPFTRVPPWGPGWGDSGLWFSGVPKNEPSDYDSAMCECLDWYMENADVSDPCAYPGSSDTILAGFPPTLFLSGTRDFAASTIVAAHARFLKLGVNSSLYLMEGAPHAAHTAAVDTPEAHDAHSYVARWFDQHLTR